ncbi:MAG: outer membrane beta-barrel protein [Candidatus Aminicenantes bacterium]|nr:outer membrane beta-barrel protein [Candidatus Aminicenantes bacterium]
MDHQIRIRPLAVAALVCGLAALPAAARAEGRLRIGLFPGSLVSLHGAYTGTASLRETVIPGAGLGLVLGYHIGPRLRLDAGYSYDWLFFKADQRPSGYKDDKPALVLPRYTLGATIVLGPPGGVEPYLTFGGGIAPWRVSSRAFGGAYLAAPADAESRFAKTSPALNGGLGIEFGVWSRLSASVEAGYLVLFAKDAAKFGASGFGHQGFLSLRCGLAFRLGSAGAADDEMDEEDEEL